MRIFTIGHGNRTLEDLVETLRAAGVETLADVRSFPGSRRNPHFGRAALDKSLPASGIAYRWIPKLGGRRPKGKRPSPNAAWEVEAFRNYADFMDSAEFHEGIDELLALAAERPTAYMCAETHPSQCHRRLISDKLTSLGHEVVHLLSPERREVHELTPFLRIDGTHLRYDRPVDEDGPARLAAGPRATKRAKKGDRRKI